MERPTSSSTRVLASLLIAALGGVLFMWTSEIITEPFAPQTPDDPPPGVVGNVLSLCFLLAGLPSIGFVATAFLWKNNRPSLTARVLLLTLGPIVATFAIVVVERWALLFAGFLAPLVFIGSLAGEVLCSNQLRHAARAKDGGHFAGGEHRE